MFTWICPQCGREVPPSYDECPDCARKQKEGTAASGEPAPPAAPAETPTRVAQPVAPPPPPMPAAAPPKPAPQPGRAAPRGAVVPAWVLSILFAFAFLGLFAGVYWFVNYMRDRGQNVPQTPARASLENPTAGRAKPHPLQKYIEVAGVRFVQNAKKQTEARFLVVNHSPDDIGDLGGVVTIWGRTQKSDEESVGSFLFKLPSLGAWQSKEMSAVIDTKLRVYELPDWQNITAEVQLTSP